MLLELHGELFVGDQRAEVLRRSKQERWLNAGLPRTHCLAHDEAEAQCDVESLHLVPVPENALLFWDRIHGAFPLCAVESLPPRPENVYWRLLRQMPCQCISA